MKKMTALILAMATLFAILTTTAYAENVADYSYEITVTAETLYLRSGPGMGPDLGWLATIRNGTKVSLLAFDTSKEYCYVEMADMTRGWLPTRFTSATAEEDVVTSELMVPIIVEADEICRVAVETTLRCEPGEDAEKASYVPKGYNCSVAAISLDANGTQWCEVHILGTEQNGWLKLADLDKLGVYGSKRYSVSESDSNFSPEASGNGYATFEFSPNYGPKQVGVTYHVITGVNLRQWRPGCENSSYLNDNTTIIVRSLGHGTPVTVTGTYGNIAYVTLADGTSGILDASFIG